MRSDVESGDRWIVKTFLTFGALLIFAATTHAQRSGGQARSLPVNLPETNPHSSQGDLEAGRRLYLGRCGNCHGQNGEGGRGVVLNTGRFRHGSSDRELFLVIRNGVPNSEMPGTFGLPEIDIWRMVAYVRQLGRQGASEPVTGDPKAGARVYQENGCALCHSIEKQGGYLGPDLTDVGAKRAVRHLRDSIVNPDADIPGDYRTVTVVTRSGRNTSGIHLNEDEYSVHLRDAGGTLRSFLKSELEEIKFPGKSLMQAYTSLSKDELENLVAYLSSLRTQRR